MPPRIPLQLDLLTGLLARIPKQGQMGLPMLESLRYQRVCCSCGFGAGGEGAAGLTQRMAPAVQNCPQRLICFDAHPGNVLITPSGKAVLVGLEKLRYSYPPLDLTRAALYASTTWGRDASFELSTEAVARAYATWGSAVGESMAGPCRRALVPLRELMWLWSVTWCAKWLAESTCSHGARSDGEDGSARNSEAALIEHVQNRVNDCLSMRCTKRMLAELHELQAPVGNNGRMTVAKL